MLFLVYRKDYSLKYNLLNSLFQAKSTKMLSKLSLIMLKNLNEMLHSDLEYYLDSGEKFDKVRFHLSVLSSSKLKSLCLACLEFTPFDTSFVIAFVLERLLLSPELILFMDFIDKSILSFM